MATQVKRRDYTMTSKARERRYFKIMQERRNYLGDRLERQEFTERSINYLRGEYAALDWALKELAKLPHLKELYLANLDDWELKNVQEVKLT